MSASPRSHLLEAPIPAWTEPPNWGRLPIVECGEPLVALRPGERLRIEPVYFRRGIPGAPETLFVRAGVRERLEHALDLLPDSLALCVADAYRPLAVQRWLWDDHAAALRQAHPEWSDDTLIAEVGQFVAAPNADPRCPPPHRTGGAVDVFLLDASTGLDVPMGTPMDDPAPESATRWYESRPQEPYTRNRRLLFGAMSAAGFANYYNEWWHFEYGNQRWANVTGAEAARYGIAPEEPG